MPPGFLAVTSQPSSQLSVDDFHAWYEEEHIPLRLNYLPSFLSGARFKAIDPPESGPGWLAMYEIDDTQAFAQESYTSLRDKRSKREASVMQRLETLTRLAGEQLIVLEGAEARNSTGLKLGQPSRCLITHLLNIAADDEDARNKLATEWADRTSRAGNTIHEYARLRLVKVLESGKTHMGSAVDLQPNEKASYFVGHGKSITARQFQGIV